MTKHRFIVTFDTATEQWTWDTDQEEQRFKGGSIELSNGSWVNSSHNDLINEVDDKASEVLCGLLNLINNMTNNNLTVTVVEE